MSRSYLLAPVSAMEAVKVELEESYEAPGYGDHRDDLSRSYILAQVAGMEVVEEPVAPGRCTSVGASSSPMTQ